MIFLNEIEELQLLEQTKNKFFNPLLNERSKKADLKISTIPLSIFSISRNDLVEKSLDKSIIDNILMKNAVINVLKSLNYKNINPISFLIGRDEKGMPFINNIEFENLPIIHVTSSHKEDIHIAAASTNKIGIDIEKKTPFKYPLKNKIFNSDEILNAMIIAENLISSNKELDSNLAHTILFSIKEAVTKSLGIGLGFDFKKILINMDHVKTQAFLEDLNLTYNIYSCYKDDFIYNLVETV